MVVSMIKDISPKPPNLLSSFATSHGPLPSLYWQCERLPSLLSVGLSQLSELNRFRVNSSTFQNSLPFPNSFSAYPPEQNENKNCTVTHTPHAETHS